MKKFLITGACVFAMLAMVPRRTEATTWSSTTVTCPVCANKVTGHSPASYGSYIYRWASKVFLIFWPWTDGHFWWMCNRCGYAAIGSGDFKNLAAKERKAIRLHVKSKWKATRSYNMRTKMNQAEACYKHRGKKIDWWILFYRAKAWNMGGASKAAAPARARGLSLMVKRLAQKGLDGRQRKELNYLIGEFLRIDGKRAKAVKHLKTALKTKWARGGKFSKGGNDYVNTLIKASLLKLGIK